MSFDQIYNTGMIQKAVMCGARLYFDQDAKTSEQELFDQAFNQDY